jgi:hypothetical protein
VTLLILLLLLLIPLCMTAAIERIKPEVNFDSVVRHRSGAPSEEVKRMLTDLQSEEPFPNGIDQEEPQSTSHGISL